MSLATDPREAAGEAARDAAGGLEGAEADLAIVFASGAHLLAPEVTVETIGDTLRPAELIGCGASGVVGEGREIEDGTAISVWAANLGDGSGDRPSTPRRRSSRARSRCSACPSSRGRAARSCSPTP